MKELRLKIDDLCEEFGLYASHFGVRNWEESIGINPKINSEEFIKRTLLACSQQFNFKEGTVPNLSAETIMQWIRNGYTKDYLRQLNLVDARLDIYDRTIKLLNNFEGLQNHLLYSDFWQMISLFYGCDPVNKKLALARMILKDSGFLLYNHNKPNIAIDYNILAVLKYLGAINYKGNFEDSREAVIKIRETAYLIMLYLIVETDKVDTVLDGEMFFLGRELRKRKLVNECLFKGCIWY